MSKKIVVSGGFDPIHVGHLRMFEEAAKLGSLTVVIDRGATNTPESRVCEELGIEMVYNVGGGKVRSSSHLVNDATEEKRKLDLETYRKVTAF